MVSFSVNDKVVIPHSASVWSVILFVMLALLSSGSQSVEPFLTVKYTIESVKSRATPLLSLNGIGLLNVFHLLMVNVEDMGESNE